MEPERSEYCSTQMTKRGQCVVECGREGGLGYAEKGQGNGSVSGGLVYAERDQRVHGSEN